MLDQFPKIYEDISLIKNRIQSSKNQKNTESSKEFEKLSLSKFQ